MAYKNAVNNILNYKKQWESATNSGDTTKAKSAEENAKAYYETLRNNNYGQVADNLASKNYSEAEQYVKDYLGTNGKTAIRPYFYSKGAQYGLSQADIDKNLSYNELTGEVSYGGINLGAPAYEAGGVSYWDSDTLDSAWDTIVGNNNYTLTDEKAYADKRDETMAQQSDLYDYIKQNAENYNKKNAALVDMARNDDPLDTDWGKGIMGYYNWQGGKAANDATASSAATNGGNVDSFAAANAARQQMAYTNSGVAAVTSAFSDRLSAVQAALNGLSANNNQAENNLMNTISLGTTQAQQSFDNDQTAKNNEQARKNSEAERLATVAGVTGYIPDEYLKGDNPFFDKKSGELLNPDMDYEAEVIQPALEVMNDPNATEAQKAAAQKMYNYGQQAKVYKTQNYSQYKQYAKTIRGYMPEETATMRTAEAENALQRYLADLGLKATEVEANASNYAVDAEERMAQAQLDAAQSAGSGGSSGSGSSSGSGDKASGSSGVNSGSGSSGGGSENGSTLTQSQFNQAIERLRKNGDVGIYINFNGTVDPTNLSLVAKVITALEKDENLTEAQRYEVLGLMGIDDDTLEAVGLTPYK